MNDIAQKLALRYGGTVAQPQELETDMGSDYNVLFVINLDDPKANYRLLTAHDLNSLSKSARETCELTKEAPFRRMRLVVYKDENGSVNFKLLHGMASRLVEEMDSLCRQPDFDF